MGLLTGRPCVKVVSDSFSALFGGVAIHRLGLSPGIVCCLVSRGEVIVTTVLRSGRSPRAMHGAVSRFLGRCG